MLLFSSTSLLGIGFHRRTIRSVTAPDLVAARVERTALSWSGTPNSWVRWGQMVFQHAQFFLSFLAGDSITYRNAPLEEDQIRARNNGCEVGGKQQEFTLSETRQ
jgi:hypothetical protein